MKIAGFLCAALAGITTVVDHATAKVPGYLDLPIKACPRYRGVNHDDIIPYRQPDPVSFDQKAAIKYKPRLTIGEDTCHMYPAVSAEGYVTGGLKPTGDLTGHCKGNQDGSQVYGRAAWHEGRYVLTYALYTPKVQLTDGYGKRHGWHCVSVWINNAAVENAKILALSVSSPHGFKKYYPINDTIVDGTNVKLKYYYRRNINNDLLSSYEFEPTAEKGGFQELIMWDQLSENARCALNLTDWGKGSKMCINDYNFRTSLKEAYPFVTKKKSVGAKSK
ncbi:hypothetical protein KXD40_004668 [Peronospora effusa]|uniref:Uncharacterized protein n=1 Tax=Peronospora effusa TaxID=542832 RepID=A0A3R7W1P8_9STRA|nr:hypothetical protein DD237_008386 [Peronospora effusa]UIZ28175.1 hypothetical protein KXD40_004668 [Peronospora effusa]CAI5721512.1 unnamed protein product [Peronospora effusa]